MEVRAEAQLPLAGLRHWVDRLWGISPERQSDALDRVRSWQIAHLEESLTRHTADACLGAVFLVESADDLIRAGVQDSKLLSKLRGDPEVWAAWAEIRAAGMLTRASPRDARLLVEPDRKEGPHADFVLEFEDGSRHAIEFKALGHSDDEARFMSGAADVLPAYLPKTGIATIHTRNFVLPSHAPTRPQRRELGRAAKKASKHLPRVASEIAAAVLVSHQHEPVYLARLQSRFVEAFRQVKSAEASWIAFHWSNGAPVHEIRRALGACEVPPNVLGIILIGSVALLGSLENYVQVLTMPFDLDEGVYLVDSTTGEDYARTILSAVDANSGVRATWLRVPWNGQEYDLLKPNGVTRIHPFNVLLSPDPPGLSDCRTQKSATGPTETPLNE